MKFSNERRRIKRRAPCDGGPRRRPTLIQRAASALNRTHAVRMGSARLRRAVFGVPPNNLEVHFDFTERWTDKGRSQGRRRDGSEVTRDACAPVSSASFRLRSIRPSRSSLTLHETPFLPPARFWFSRPDGKRDGAKCNALREFSESCVPEGQRENSPAFQRRERWTGRLSPEGTAEVLRGSVRGFIRPFGTGPCWFVPPGVETPGYCRLSLRDKHPNEFPKGTIFSVILARPRSIPSI